MVRLNRGTGASGGRADETAGAGAVADGLRRAIDSGGLSDAARLTLLRQVAARTAGALDPADGAPLWAGIELHVSEYAEIPTGAGLHAIVAELARVGPSGGVTALVSPPGGYGVVVAPAAHLRALMRRTEELETALAEVAGLAAEILAARDGTDAPGQLGERPLRGPPGSL